MNRIVSIGGQLFCIVIMNILILIVPLWMFKLFVHVFNGRILFSLLPFIQELVMFVSMSNCFVDDLNENAMWKIHQSIRKLKRSVFSGGYKGDFFYFIFLTMYYGCSSSVTYIVTPDVNE